MNVLITGGTGYLGRRLLAHYANLEVTERVICYSRGEAQQWRVREAIPERLTSHAEFDKLRWMVGDVRDLERLERACQGVDVLIHAAALKRVEVGEYCPSEMVDTNIGGTRNALAAATRARVKVLALISSDKAVQPHNAYGATKMVAEKIVLSWPTENRHSPSVAVARYGNVAGSTGSVIPVWCATGARSLQPIGTDADATRYWMEPGHAVRLINDCVSRAYDVRKPFVAVPTLPAYTLGDLAAAMLDRGMIKQEPHWIGLRPGEKLHESMVSPLEIDIFRSDDAGTNFRFYPMPTNSRAAPSPISLTSSASAEQMTRSDLLGRLGFFEGRQEW